MKSQREVWSLVENWKEDPSWDLESAEGFEEHSGFLKAYSEYWLAISAIIPMMDELETQAISYERKAREIRGKAKALKDARLYMLERPPEMESDAHYRHCPDCMLPVDDVKGIAACEAAHKGATGND